MNPLSIDQIRALLMPGVKVSNEKKLDVIERVDDEFIHFKYQGPYLKECIVMLIKETLWNIAK